MNTDEEGFQAVLDHRLKGPDDEPSNVARTKVVRTTLVGAQLHPAISKQLGLVAIEEGKTKRECIEEALDLFFLKRNLPRIDELMAE